MKDKDFAKLVAPLCQELPKEKVNAEMLEKSIEAIMKQAEDKILALASRFRTEVLLPFCKEHGVTFAAGNGTFVFYKDGEGIYNDAYEWLNGEDEVVFCIDPEIIEILDLTTTGTNCDFSYYVQDITEKDIE